MTLMRTIEKGGMKGFVPILLVLMIFAGCAAGVKKSFTIVSDPPDAVIKVVSGEDLKESTYSSPAEITVRMQKDSRLWPKNFVEVSRDAYKPKKILIRDIKDGQRITVSLDRIVRYSLKHRLVSPVVSEDISFDDKMISISFSIDEQSFGMSLTNHTSLPLRILWDRAEYTDVNNRPHRLMHSGVRPQDRNNPIPAQTVPAGVTIKQALMAADSFIYNPEKKAYESRPIFPLDSDIAAELKGRVFYLFIPIEIDRQIIPYNFKIEITDAVKQGV